MSMASPGSGELAQDLMEADLEAMWLRPTLQDDDPDWLALLPLTQPE